MSAMLTALVTAKPHGLACMVTTPSGGVFLVDGLSHDKCFHKTAVCVYVTLQARLSHSQSQAISETISQLRHLHRRVGPRSSAGTATHQLRPWLAQTPRTETRSSAR